MDKHVKNMLWFYLVYITKNIYNFLTIFETNIFFFFDHSPKIVSDTILIDYLKKMLKVRTT